MDLALPSDFELRIWDFYQGIAMSSLLLWNVAWSAALAVGVFCVGRLPALRRRPAVMHILWFGVLLRLVVPAVIAIPVLPDATATVRVEADFTNAVPRNVSVEFVPAEVAQPKEPVESVEPQFVSRTKAWTLFDVLLAVSLAGTFVLLIASAIRCWRLLRLKSASDAAPDHLGELIAQLAGERKLSRVPKLRIVDGLATPSLWGFGRRATILLPRHLVDDFDGDQWSCILAHELAHVARGDVWFNLAAAAGVLHLFWWNPVAWWAYQEMRAAQEAGCDALALSQSSASRRRYAETLLHVVDSWNRPSLVQLHVVLGFGTRSVLTRRFEMIADSSVRPRSAAAASLCLGMLALAFFCLPVRAEKAAEDEPQTDQDRIQGSWQGVKAEVNGQAAPKEQVEKGRYVFKENKLTIFQGDKIVEESEFTLDPNENPKAIDIVGNNRRVTGVKYFGIYRIEDDVLTLCLGGERPKEFSGAGKVGLLEFKKVKDEKAAEIAQKTAPTDDAKKAEAPALTGEKIAELKTASRDHIKMIILAMHNYLDQHGSFPPAALYGKDNKGGKHPHSWRVALLPHLAESKLYESYKFDEPWDSPANKEILAKMPYAFRDPNADDKSVNSSYYVLVGTLMEDDKEPKKLQTLFSSKNGVRVSMVRDGTSNTLAVVEAKRDIPWTKPEDIEYDPGKALPNLGGLYKGGFFFGMADGGANFVFDELVKEATIKELISPASGNPLIGEELAKSNALLRQQLSANATENSTKPSEAVLLKYDDGKPDGKKSIAGTGEMIHFVAPEKSLKLKSLRLHCARYGTPKAPNEDVDFSIISDDEATVLHTELVPYSRFKRGESRWTTIEFKEPVDVPEKFWIVVDFNAEQTKGVYLSYDTRTGGKHSKTGVPGGESKPVTTGGDWMIQAVLTK